MKLTVAIALAAAAIAQEPAFRADISLIEVDAVAIGRTGVIEDLKLSDFAILDNKQPVRLRYCVQEETPLDILMLFETSRLMVKHRDQIKTAAEMAMAEFQDGDRFAAMSFSESTKLEWPFTSDLKKDAKRRIRNGLDEAWYGGNPNILAAADASAKFLASESGPHRRRVVLMFTGDAGFGEKKESHSALANALWDADAFLSPIVIPNGLTRLASDDNPQHFQYLQQLANSVGFSLFDFVDDVAEQTGGEVVTAGAAIRPKIQRMRKRYKLYYDRPEGKPGQRRQIAIELTAEAQARYPGARIVARKGYAMPKPGRNAIQ
jgi:VWFA-related protein